MNHRVRTGLLGGIILCLSSTSSLASTEGTDPSFRVVPTFASRLHDGATGLVSRDALILLGAGAGTAYALSFGEDPAQISRALDGSRLEGGIDGGDLFGDGRTVAVGALGLVVVGQLGQDRWGAVGRDLLASFLVTGAVTWTLKVGVGRRRPLGGPHSFPSGHTATAFSTLPVITHHAGPWVGLAATALAVGTGAARLEDQRHFTSDVVFGAALGYAVGRAVIGRPVPWATVWEKLTFSGDGIGVRMRF